MSEVIYHIPALLTESIQGLNISPEGVYVDVTFGGGGHSRAIMAELGEQGRLFSFDQDIDAYANRIDDARFTFVHSNFRYLSNFMRFHEVEQVDGIMADLGVSFHHFDDTKRGFSFRFDGELDMRMNQKATVDAKSIIMTSSEERLAEIFYLYGELKSSRRIASLIVKARATQQINTTDQLLKIIKPAVKPAQEKKELAQIFQALRIVVNNEIEVLRDLLTQSMNLLAPGGRMAVLTYHSLEDRLVKNFFRSGNLEGHLEKDFFGRVTTPFKLVNNKVIMPTEQEIERNPRSRSAKLRIAEKL
ncbi:MAG: 16S rRNA (cytosine(1402)-N(4))-methyltransferase RsmH [Bacteroidales bacterium]